MANIDDENYEQQIAKEKSHLTVMQQLKRELNVLIDKYPDVLDDIKLYIDVNDKNIDKLTKAEMNELISLCINNQISRERADNESK